MIAQRGNEYYAALTEQAKTDARLQNIDLKTRLEFIGQRLLPEMKAAVALLNQKYPGVLQYLTHNSARKLTTKLAQAQDPAMMLSEKGEPSHKKRKRKVKAKAKKTGKGNR